MPEQVSRLQFAHAELPESYKKEGLRLLTQLDRYKDDYTLMIDRLARHIVREANAAALPPLTLLAPLKEVLPAWGGNSVAPSAAPAERGPSNVRFLYLAGTVNELRSKRTFLEAYSENGGWHWKPFLPDDRTVGAISYFAALGIGLVPKQINLTANVAAALTAASHENEIVVVIADSWTLMLDKYLGLADQYDNLVLPYAGAITFSNPADPEAAAHLAELSDALQHAFLNRRVMSVPGHFWGGISSSESLQSHLAALLIDLKMRVLAIGKLRRRTESPTLAAQARLQGIDLASNAILSLTDDR